MQAYLMQNRCCVYGCFFNNSSNTHAHELLTKMIVRSFISPRVFTVYMENSLRFEICTEVSFTSPELM